MESLTQYTIPSPPPVISPQQKIIQELNTHISNMSVFLSSKYCPPEHKETYLTFLTKQQIWVHYLSHQVDIDPSLKRELQFWVNGHKECAQYSFDNDQYISTEAKQRCLAKIEDYNTFLAWLQTQL